MKTYKEMAQSVLQKARTQRKRRNRIAATAASVLVVCAAIFAAIALDSHQHGKADTPRLVVMCEAAAFSDQPEKLVDVVTPLKFLIRVRDLRNVRQDGQLVDLIAQEALFRENIWNEEREDGRKSDCQYIRWQNEDAMISLLYQGFLYLTVADSEKIQSVSVTTTDVGSATVNRYNRRGDGASEPEECISVNWVLSDATVEAIQKDPDKKLSEISDTIRVKVLFQDGTTEIAVIELTVDDKGQIYVRHKGSITTE